MLSIQKLPFPRHFGLKHMKDYVLPEVLFLEQWYIPKGTTIRLSTGRDFGYAVLPADCKDERGFVVPKRIFKY